MSEAFIKNLQQAARENILGGLVVAAQSQDAMNQREKLSSIMQKFSDGMKQIDTSNPGNTSEQYNEIVKDAKVNQELSGFESMMRDYSVSLNKYMESNAKLNKLQTEAEMGMAGLTVEEAEQSRKSIASAVGRKAEELKFNTERVKQELDFAKGLYDLTNASLQTEEYILKINQFKNDVKVKSLTNKLINNDAFNKFKFAFDEATGSYTYDMSKLRQELYNTIDPETGNKLGEDPRFSDSFALLNDMIRKSWTKDYRTDVQGRLKQLESIFESQQKALSLYGDLKQNTIWLDNIFKNSKWANARQEYKEAYINLYGKNEPGDSVFNAEAYGALPDVIEAMPTKSFRDEFKLVHDYLYNPRSFNYGGHLTNELESITGQAPQLGLSLRNVTQDGKVVDYPYADVYFPSKKGGHAENIPMSSSTPGISWSSPTDLRNYESAKELYDRTAKRAKELRGAEEMRRRLTSKQELPGYGRGGSYGSNIDLFGTNNK